VQQLRDLLLRLADRDAKRSEATIQADVRTLLLEAPFQLSEDDVREVHLESQTGERRRIDVEMGTTVIEVKRDLRRPGVLADALKQLAGYVETREAEMKRRYVGVLTDGAEWRCFQLTTNGLEEASTLTIRKDKLDPDALVVWLEGVLATAQQIPPIPQEITLRLGVGSSAHALDTTSLRTLYAAHKDHPSVRMKRQLWARLLTTALGSQFQDTDDLFVEHTLLVNTAEVIAHAVLGLDVALLSPASLLSGTKFSEHGLHGVVEPDFFDWVVFVPRGDSFIRTLARRLSRFDWRSVEHDVLKVLYESVIPAETRKKLGEYYTPDWLAERMVEETVREPLQERVLDPACGSGTFLFHAVRKYLQASDAAGLSVRDSLTGVSSHVIGMDLHPVAVTLARVTYVLAIGSERLTNPERDAIQIPVYLGDSMQWQQKQLELWTAGYLVIQVDSELNIFAHELRFPDALVNDARKFDELVEEMAKKASERQAESPIPSLLPLFQRLGIPEPLQLTVEETFLSMCHLHDEGRNHIWGYYVRNLARPVWLAQPDNRVDTLIGNPPWLAYRHMTRDMQAKFKEMSESRGLWHGAKVATHQDLSALFVTRVVQLYLQSEGRFAFVMPNAVLDREQFAGFRKGEYPDAANLVRIAFQTPWDLRRLRPHFFPRGSAVVFGQRVSEGVRRMPKTIETWSGRLPPEASSWSGVEGNLLRQLKQARSTEEKFESPYRKRFRQGASVVPRVLFMVEERPPGPLGLKSGMRAVRSVRSANEKRPWKDLEALEGVVESEFAYRLYLGEHVLPYRTLPPSRAVLPWLNAELLPSDNSRLELFPGLATWWRQAEEIWNANRSSERLSLIEQLDYHSKLSAQSPIQATRIVYTKSGMHLAAARIEDRRHVIDHKLYWATPASRDEALFLCAILNSAEITRQVRPLMSYGKDERDIDKHIWRLPIPEFDSSNPLHAELSSLAAKVEQEVSAIQLDEARNFVALRRQVRSFLAESTRAQQIERIVAKLVK
jgi:hypothetical protein